MGDLAIASSAPLLAVAVGVGLHLLAKATVLALVATVYTKLGVEVLRRAWLNTKQSGRPPS